MVLIIGTEVHLILEIQWDRHTCIYFLLSLPFIYCNVSFIFIYFAYSGGVDFATVNIFVLNYPQALLYRSNIIFSFVSLVAGRKYCYRTLIERTLESKEEILSYIGNYVCCFHSLKSIFSPFL